MLLFVLVCCIGTPTSLQAQTADSIARDQIALEQANANLAQIQKARNAIAKAMSVGKFIQKLDSLAFIEFPVVLADTIGNVPVHIMFDDLRLYPEYAQLEVIVGMQLPQRKVSAQAGATISQPATGPDGEPNAPISDYVELFFGTPDLKFSHDGGVLGEATIALYSDVPIGTDDPSKFGLTLKGFSGVKKQGESIDGGTYVTIDCDGFVEMGVEADVMFSRDWIVPVTPTDQVIPTGRVAGNIKTQLTDWNNFLVEVSLPNFALADDTDWVFNLNAAVFDFSDFRNSTSMSFPDGYVANYLPPGNVNLWRGVYIKELDVAFPNQLNKSCAGTSSLDRATPSGLLLDQYGTYTMGEKPIELGEDLAPLAYAEPSTELANVRGPAPAEPLYVDGNQPVLGPVLPELEHTEGTTNPAPAAAPLLAANAEENATFELDIPDFKRQYEESLAPACRTRVGVKGLLIDAQGVSGKFYADNVLDLGDGAQMDSWGFTIAHAELELLTNDVIDFQFNGQIRIPVAKGNETLAYSAYHNVPSQTWNITATAESDMTFPVLKMASVSIDSATYIDVTVTPTTFEPKAVIYARAAIKAKQGSGNPDGDDGNEPKESLTVHAAEVNVQGLMLATKGRKFGLEQDGYISFITQPTLAKFPIGIDSVVLRNAPNNEFELRVAVQISLMGQQGNGLAAKSDFSIFSEIVTNQGRDKIEFRRILVNRIDVNMQFTGFSMQGHVLFLRDDPVYGDGFQGGLLIKVGEAANPTIEVSLNAMFGKVPDSNGNPYNYWFVEGMVSGSAINIPVIPGILFIDGFGGGAYYHMRMASVTPNVVNRRDQMNGATPSTGGAGVTNSGVTYVPDANIALGLKATLSLRSAPGAKLYSGVVTVEVVFSNTALQNIMIYGQVDIMPAFASQAGAVGFKVAALEMSKEEKQAETKAAIKNNPGAIGLAFYISMDFSNGFILKGAFDAHMDLANSTIKGQGTTDILYNSTNGKWHLYVGGYEGGSMTSATGAPLHPVSVTLNLGSGLNAWAKAYFLTGNDIPGAPPVPHDVASYFNIGTNTNNRGSLSGKAAQGTGFALGASIGLRVYKDDGWFGVDANFRTGFDISLLKYPEGSYCSNTSNYNAPHGAKYWRATGRFYLMLWAKARLFGVWTPKINAGVYIDADIPNPSRLRVKGKFQGIWLPSVKLGSRCGTVYL
ncbi:hypothetical protein [Lewinella sp. 4G2]|uniref:hypothetical protein n=1 Tax=Lewinella sp. 4G2 TaxID=1803372 RepID=UPI0007B4871D|nr:hypothetical protein [Lewinella sp. 4G2]OAV43833.1 hypothetical protein A3850_004660 [Lewinella sp. 4G2]